MKRDPVVKNMPVIRERALGVVAEDLMQPGTRRFKMGKCRILLSPPHAEAGIGWHMSISRSDRYPSWDEIAHARYELLPDDILMVMHLPPPDEYVALHKFTFHLHEADEDSKILKRFRDG